MWEDALDGEKGDPTFRSDRSVLWAEFEQPVKRRLKDNRGDNKQLNLKGSNPKNHEAMKKFRHDTCRDLMDLMSSTDRSATETSTAAKLEKAENIIASAARAAAGQTGTGGIPGRPKCPRILAEFEREASQQTTPPDRKRELRRQARQERRRWQAEPAEWRLRHPPQSSAPRLPTCMQLRTGEKTSHTTKWSKDLHHYCADKYSGPEESGEQELFEELNQQVREDDGGNTDTMQWTWATTIQARASMTKGKSTGRNDPSAEVLQGLSNEALWIIHTMLIEHYNSEHRGPISWSHIRLYLLPKVRQPLDWDMFRGICVLSVLSKMFMAGVMTLVKQRADLHLGSAWSDQLLYGFEPGCKCEDLLMTIQAAAQTSAEWPSSMPLVLCNTDVRQAFGFCIAFHGCAVSSLLELSPEDGAGHRQGVAIHPGRGGVRRCANNSGVPDGEVDPPGRHRVALVLQFGGAHHPGGRGTFATRAGCGASTHPQDSSDRLGRQPLVYGSQT